jgi:hypothetical protein
MKLCQNASALLSVVFGIKEMTPGSKLEHAEHVCKALNKAGAVVEPFRDVATTKKKSNFSQKQAYRTKTRQTCQRKHVLHH